MSEWTPGDLSADEAYELAAERARRETLRLLLTEREEWTVDDLASEVAAREHETTPAAIDEETHKHVAVTLVHRDLPKLDDAGAVAFDVEDETVTPRPSIDEFDELL